MKIHSKLELKEFVKYEESFYGNTWLKYLPVDICERQILSKHIYRLRLTEYYSNTGKKMRAFISKVLLRRIQNRYSLQIPLNVAGKGLHIMHLGSVLINHEATIGENCTIHINTAIVAGGRNSYAPRIGNNVVIGVGTTILGQVEIADNIAIGANSLVNKSFLDEGICIAGNPAKYISNNGSSSWGNNKKSINL